MSFYDEMVDVVVELLGPGDDTFGEQLTIQRPSIAGYDKVTRKTAPGAARVMSVWGTTDTEIQPVADAGSLIAKYERVLYAVPKTGPDAFVPGVNDRVVDSSGTYMVDATGHVVKQGKPILWICGLIST